MNKNKNCTQKIRQVKVALPQLTLPQLALPPTGTPPNWPSPRAKNPQLPVQRKFQPTYFFHKDISHEIGPQKI